jgi:RNA polymerase sigma factor (sigma-70 family)
MASGQIKQKQRQLNPTGLLSLATEGQSDRQLLDRFVHHNDEVAFEALVQRYGPMILGLCRRILHDAHDADDAFQATFLVLVRKAGRISNPDLLGNWLYGVAYRVAVKARSNAARRIVNERQAASMPKPEPMDDPIGWELRSVIDEEINRLPEKYRGPLVLCYLEGKTNEQAARLLGCPTGSMSWRLSRGREMLRKRLDRRNLALAPLLFLPLLTQNVSSAAVPAGLVKATVTAASKFALASGAASGAASASVMALTEEILKTFGASKLKLVTVVAAVLAAALLTIQLSSLIAGFQGASAPINEADQHGCSAPDNPSDRR